MPWKVVAKSDSEAEIFIHGIIGGYNDQWEKQSAMHFINKIKELGEVSSITLRINSVGGDVFEAQALYGYLKMHKATKTVYIDGLAASAASLIAMAGDRIVMPENALMMIHNPATIAWGTATDLRKEADVLEKVRDTLVAVYKSKTSLESSVLEKMMDDETWMTSDEALAMGFCDETEDAVEIAACADGGGLSISTTTGTTVVPKSLAAKIPAALKTFTAMVAPGTILELKGDDVVDFKTVAELEGKYPALVAEIRSNAEKEAHAKGIGEERMRILALDKLNKPGREAVIAKAKYDEPKDARDVALDLLDADKIQSVIENRRADAGGLDGITLPTAQIGETEKREKAADAVADIINEKRGYRK